MPAARRVDYCKLWTVQSQPGSQSSAALSQGEGHRHLDLVLSQAALQI